MKKYEKLIKILKINPKGKTEKQMDDEIWKAFCDLPISSAPKTFLKLDKKTAISCALTKGKVEGMQQAQKLFHEVYNSTSEK